jgi:hypothetical protein
MRHTAESPAVFRDSEASGEWVLAAKQNGSQVNKPDEDCKQDAACDSGGTSVPYPASSNVPSGAHAMLCGRGVWERDDAYPCIVRVGDVRVIECRDRLQWIWQRRRKGGTWRDLGYFRNRNVLIERSGLDCAALRALPPYHLGCAP